MCVLVCVVALCCVMFGVLCGVVVFVLFVFVACVCCCVYVVVVCSVCCVCCVDLM